MPPMPFEVRYSTRAVKQLKKLRAFDRATILDEIERTGLMKSRKIHDLNVSLGAILKLLGGKGGVVEIAGKQGYILLPLDDERIDVLLERSPRLIKECRQIRARMAAGQFVKHEQVKKRL